VVASVLFLSILISVAIRAPVAATGKAASAGGAVEPRRAREDRAA
jgi:hypothetical protein